MFRHLLSLVLVFSLPQAMAQEVEKKLICSMPATPTDNLARYKVSFDAIGNYCYFSRIGEGTGPVVTSTSTYGPFRKYDDHGGPIIFYDEKDKGQYILGKHSAAMYGPIDGDIDITSYPFQVEEDYFNFIVSQGDSFGYYINGRIIATTQSYPCTYNWCACSRNGHTLYTIRRKELNYLYLDNKLIDSTLDDYGWLEVDDNDSYRYALGKRVPNEHGWVNLARFAPFPRYRQKIFAPLASPGREYVGLNYDSVYIYENGETGSCLTVVNRRKWLQAKRLVVKAPCKGRNNLSYVPIGWGATVTDTSAQIYVNNKAVKLPYKEIFFPCIDSLGNYALFGQRGYYMYRNINGVEQPQPLSKHGVRAKPISIDAQGNTICYYQTDDSIFVYENDRLFGKCPLSQFELVRQDEIVPSYRMNTDMRDHTPSELSGFCFDSSCYIVYRNTISPRMCSFKRYHGGEERIKGDIIYGMITETGYCVLQKTGDRKYSLIVNSRLIPFPADADFDTQMWFTLSQNFSFTSHKFIFYSKEGTGIYQYKMKL